MWTNPSSTAPNIILITIDCWRGDHLGAIDHTKVQTPHLNRLASEEILFSQAYTCGGWTPIAMTALFSSTYASMYNFSQGKLSDERPMLAEILQQHGYDTAGFTTNLVCGRHLGFDRGFNTFIELKPDLKPKGIGRLRELRGMGRFVQYRAFHRLLQLFGIYLMPLLPFTTADDLVDQALDWLSQPRSQPYFLWLHFMDIHWPYHFSRLRPTPTETVESWRDRSIFTNHVRRQRGRYSPGWSRSQRWQKFYAEEMQTVDEALGRLFDQLRQRQDWSRTTMFATGDHGEEFQEHGTWGHSWNQLHREGTHVPLIVRLPQSTGQRRIEQPVSHIDLAPTMLQLADIAPPQQMLGHSLLPLFDTNPVMLDRPIYTEMLGHRNSYRYRLAILADGYTYIYDGDENRCLLFNLQVDPDETTNIYATETVVARRFDTLRLAHVSKGVINTLKNQSQFNVDHIPYNIDTDPTIVERLRALGYLD